MINTKFGLQILSNLGLIFVTLYSFNSSKCVVIRRAYVCNVSIMRTTGAQMRETFLALMFYGRKRRRKLLSRETVSRWRILF